MSAQDFVNGYRPYDGEPLGQPTRKTETFANRMPVSPARAAAFHILLRVEQEDAYASELLHSECCATDVDQALTTELVMGVLRWRSALDDAIGSVSSQNLARLDREVLTSLRLGAYQLGWLDRVPARAAIHESVELVKRARKRSAAPFANAILRKLAENPRIHADFQPLLAAADPNHRQDFRPPTLAGRALDRSIWGRDHCTDMRLQPGASGDCHPAA